MAKQEAMEEERYFRRGNAAAVSLAVVAMLLAAALPAHAKVWRVDCSAPGAPGRVEAQESRQDDAAATLHSLAEVNRLALQAGDEVLFRRGTVCRGRLSPQGSGAAGRPIHLGAFGSGLRPRIEAAPDDEAALQLHDQQYWEIESLDISGSRDFGVHIAASHGLLHHIVLRDLTVHGVGRGNESPKKKSSGLVVINAAAGAGFDDVVIDGVIAHDSTQWAGIMVEGAEGPVVTRNVTVRNSMVHDVEGDGIVLFRQSDGVIENSVAWHTGMQHTESIGTPNAIWTWACTHCTVQNNEAFLTDSPGIDGGAFDVDFWSTDTVVRDNYGHDTQGYCVSVFGAFHVTRRSTVSGNLCIHNGLSPRLAARQGAIFLMTWYDGSIEDVRIAGNRIYFAPAGKMAAIQQGPGIKISGLVIENNAVTSTVNLAAAPGMPWEGHGNTFTLGEFQVQAEGTTTATTSLPEWARSTAPKPDKRGWRLLVAMPETGDDVVARDAVGQLMLLRSQAMQFRNAGLEVTVACRCTEQRIKQLDSDWQLAEDGVHLATWPSEAPSSQTAVLINPRGAVEETWQGALTPIGLGEALRRVLGDPKFSGLPVR